MIKNNKRMKLFAFIFASIMMFGFISINAYADDNSAFIDLESSKTNSNTKDLNQNYTFSQTGNTNYTDVTKVKLTWNISDIEVTYASNKTWDLDTLSWKETKLVDDIANKTAEFTLTNYSSKKVIGTVGFKVEDSLKDTLKSATFDGNNGKTIDSVVNSDYTIDETKEDELPTNTITATLEFNKDKFANLSATTYASNYGTYTVTISSPSKIDAKVTSPTSISNLTYTGSPLELISAGITDGGTWMYKLDDGEYSPTIPTATKVGTYTVYYMLDGGDDYNDIDEASFEVTIGKATQEISAPTKASATAASVTLNAISAGVGATKYGYNTTNTAPDTWQDSVEFKGLKANSTYYFFAKYVGNDNYNEAISSGISITTNKIYTLNFNIANATGSSDNPTTIEEGQTATLIFNANNNYYLPTDIKYSDVISITGATIDS